MREVETENDNLYPLACGQVVQGDATLLGMTGS
jgi:hypothetical protein